MNVIVSSLRNRMPLMETLRSNEEGNDIADDTRARLVVDRDIEF